MRADVAVVGSGLAAMTAARALQTAGRQVVLVHPGLSSLYFLFATLDVAGYATPTATDPIDDPLLEVTRVIAAEPSHPYARSGLAALEQGTALLLDWVREAGLHWEGTLRHNLLLPTATGTPKPSCLVPSSMAWGDLRRTEPIVLCGFDGYQDFAPELAASNLARHWTHGPGTVRGIRVSLPGYGPDRHFTSIDLARSFEDASFRTTVAQLVRRAITDDRARIGFPAVLGLTQHDEAFAGLKDAIGHPIFEIPTLPPSVPALRLFDRLRRHLQETGVEIVWAAPAHAAEVRDGTCVRILLKAPGREQPVDARAYILALEDWVDGALRAGVHQVRDPFFDRVLAQHATPAERTAESLFTPQPFAQIGYPVNERLQPLDEQGTPLARNVFVAGGAIAGYDPAPTRSRGGMAVATGYRAAQEALAC